MVHATTPARRVLLLGSSFGFGFAVLAASGAFTGCIQPSDEYNDYVSRTADARGGGPVQETGPIDASAPAGSFSGQYLLSCLAHLVTSADQALKYQVGLSFVANADGKGGKLTATSITPIHKFTDDYSNSVPPAYPSFSATVNADSTFALDLGKPFIPAAANPISANDIQFDTPPADLCAQSGRCVAAVIHGFLTAQDKFCGGLDGYVAKPTPIPLDPASDICLFQKVSETGAPLPSGPGTLPTYTRDDYHCP